MTRLLLVAATLVAVLAAAGVGAGAEWDVYPGAGTPIQDAIDSAEVGDMIYVHAGTYVENVNVDNRVTLIGDGADVVTVRAADAGDHVFEVTADWVNISGFTVTGARDGYRAGIQIYNADRCKIFDNNASNNCYGIFLYFSSDNTLTNNTFIDDGLLVAYSYKNTVENNTVNGKPLVYLDDTSNLIIKNAGQIILMNCTNITVENLNLSNASIGIDLWETNDCTIVNNTASNNVCGINMWHSSNYNTLQSNKVSNNWVGISLSSSSNNTLTNNTANSNNYDGIVMEYSSDNTLQGNTANSNDEYGIHLSWSSSNNTLQSNTMPGNTYNFGVYDEHIQNIDTSNTVDEKPIYYWVDQHDMQIPADAGFVGIVDSTDITVKDLTLTNNYHGVLFAYTENSRIENVTTSNNYDGIYLRSSNNNTLQGNIANSNDDFGVHLLGSSNNTLRGNVASNNWYGICLQGSSSNNILYHNNLLNNTNNTQHAYDYGANANQWDSGSVGNYYSNYNGTDPDGDGIGNDPYPILGGTSIDRFPLMQP